MIHDAHLPPATLGAGRLPAWLGTVAAVARKELLLMARYPAESLAGFVQVFLMIAVFTLATLTFAPEGAPSGDGRELLAGVMVYGFVLFIFLTEALWSLGLSVRREQRQGTLEQLYLSPASRTAGLVARALVTLLWTAVVAALSIWMMAAMIGGLPASNLPLAALILVLTLSGTFGVGFAFAAASLRLRETAPTLATVVQFGFMILCAPFYPFGVLPEWVLPVSRAIPLSYAVDAFRSVLAGHPAGYPELAPLGIELAVVALFGILTPLFGLWLYGREEHRARRSGTLSEY